ncbi:MAG: hypothetical protein ACUVSW_05795 [Roseiflexus sp.]
MQRLKYNPSSIHRVLSAWRQLRRAPVIAGVAFAMAAWMAGIPWMALLIGGSSIVIGGAHVWWRWATCERPPMRPTLFVVRHRHHSTLRLLRAIEADLDRDIATIETIVRQVDVMCAPVNANPPDKTGRTIDI